MTLMGILIKPGARNDKVLSEHQVNGVFQILHTNKLEESFVLKLINKFYRFLLGYIPPYIITNYMRENHQDIIALNFNQPSVFSWNNYEVTKNFQGFQDLIPLFWMSPLNRGIIRQDID